MLSKRIYLDYASLTPIDPRVIREVRAYSSTKYANPSSLYREGISAKKTLQDAHGTVADFLGAHSDEIILTSGGTESNNIAIIGTIEKLHAEGVPYNDMHVLVSVIEHSSVRECANYLSSKDVVVEVVEVASNGVIVFDDLKKKIRKNTIIVSIMTVNNELGTIQPIKEIAKTIRHARKENGSIYPLFHTDSAQAVLYEDLNVERLGVDLLTLDSSKAYGPRSIGALYVKRNTPITSIIHGGGQEKGMRSGTENIPSIMGFAKALSIAKTDRDTEKVRIAELRDYFIKEVLNVRKGIVINGMPPISESSNLPIFSPHIVNISIPRIDNEFFVLQLDVQGIACSTKSSCLRDEDESYVLKAIGADSKISVRFSFGRWTKKKDIDTAIKAMKKVLF